MAAFLCKYVDSSFISLKNNNDAIRNRCCSRPGLLHEAFVICPMPKITFRWHTERPSEHSDKGARALVVQLNGHRGHCLSLT